MVPLLSVCSLRMSLLFFIDHLCTEMESELEKLRLTQQRIVLAARASSFGIGRPAEIAPAEMAKSEAVKSEIAAAPTPTRPSLAAEQVKSRDLAWMLAPDHDEAAGARSAEAEKILERLRNFAPKK